ncbi:hypothetical protein ACH5RR_032634 [Cinchona calisaya]|uniref:Transferase, Chloramphenicol acetyltransferase-like domain protein n=1 Tax=Cinchona calisaya TaxID=153742 RepID=A0ABD2YIM7_9GENT
MPNTDSSQFSCQLKQSLSNLLTTYYPLAGRIDEVNDFVDCNDTGALFVEAQVHAFLSQTIQRSTMEEFDHYLPIKPYAIRDVTNRDIVLAIQISFFECGGIGIGVCISHKVADLMSLVTFVNAWAATCRGETKLILQPNFNFGSQHFPPMHNYKSLFSKQIVEKPMLVKAKVVTKCFIFGKENLIELKALASSATNTKVKDPTRVEVVSAFICKQLMEMNNARVNPKSMISFSHSVNLRTRMIRLDQEFAFGNLSPVSMSALLTYKKDEKFHDLVSEVRTVTRKFNEICDENVVLDEMKKSSTIVSQPDIQHCHFTSSCKFLLHEVDFGWGKPIFVRARALPVQNTIILMDTKSGDGIQALISLVDEDMEMLPNELLSLENNGFRK